MTIVVNRTASVQSFGGPTSVQFQSTKLNLPTEDQLKPRQVLIRVKYCGLNDYDCMVREGVYQFMHKKDQTIVLGYEFSGRVVHTGKDVVGFSEGDDVCGVVSVDQERGACQDYCIVDAHQLLHIPSGLSMESAASCLWSGIRAIHALNHMCRIERGETIFISQGAAPSGFIAIQIASLIKGARVICSIQTDEELNAIQDLKAPVLRIIDERTEDVNTVILEETGGLGVDVYLDIAGDHLLSETFQVLAPLATFLSPFPDCCSYNRALSKHMFLKSLKIGYMHEMAFLTSQSQQGRFLHMAKLILDLVCKGQVQLVETQIFPIEKIRECHRKLQIIKNRRIICHFSEASVSD